jgi:geranylgeranyl diphosphate synthase type I
MDMKRDLDLKMELEKRASFFNKQLEIFLSEGNPEELYDAARHLPFAGGKRLRPVIAMISCEAVNGDIMRVIPLAIALELIHNFTLVHDDIMDKSKLRRGLAAVHIKYGEPTAIIAGDLLFTKAFQSMHDIIGDLSVFKNVEYGLIDCIKEICEGQQLDMEFEKRNDVTEEEYFNMIRKKTAVFFQYAAEAGAILGGAEKEQSYMLNQFGLDLGLGFQIWDDYLDISSDEAILGKDIGNDIRNGKKTLIAVDSLNKAKGEDKKFLNKIFGKKDATEKEIEQVYKLFERLGSIDYARKIAIKYCNKAKKSLEIIIESDAKSILKALADYAVKRKK